MAGLDILTMPLVGRHLIDASAGTGKTYTISALVVRLIIERQLTIDCILIVTYTEAATADLKGRVREMIKDAIAAFGQGAGAEGFLADLVAGCKDHKAAEARLAAALLDFDLAAIFTIHAFCQRMLLENSMESGVLFDTELVADMSGLNRDVAHDFYRRNLYEAPPLFVKYCRQQKINPAFFIDFLKKYYPYTDLNIIPACDHENIMAAVAHLADDYGKVFGEAAAVWPAARADVSGLLQGNPSLNGNKYRQKSIIKWLAALDVLLASAEPEPWLFDGFVKFTDSGLAAGVKKGQTPPGHLFFSICERLYDIGQELAAVFARAGQSLQREFLAFAGSELMVRKEKDNIFSFDDLLRGLNSGLASANGGRLAEAIGKRFPAALIDEFQDTDPVQFQIFSTIYHSAKQTLFLIGDPKQAIYSFRGADIFSYLRASRDICDHHTLEHNWRSAPALITAVNNIFAAGADNPFIFQEISFAAVLAAENKNDRAALLIDNAAESPMQLWLANRKEESNPEKLLGVEASMARILTPLAAEIARLIKLGNQGRAKIGERNLHGGDIAILVRTNFEARQVRDVLAEYGVACALQSTENLFSSHEAQELLVLLTALARQNEARSMRAALVTDYLGVDAGELDRLLAGDDFEGWRFSFQQYHLIWQRHGFMAMITAFMSGQEVRKRLLMLNNGERRLTNLLHLIEILQRISIEKGLGVNGLLQMLVEKIATASAALAEEYQLRLESDGHRVQVVTIHKSKGLQYPIVFCPFSWRVAVDKSNIHCLYHQRHGDNGLQLDLGSDARDDHLKLAAEERLAENLRLLYVALTRAQERCYLVWGPFSGAVGSGLNYLLHRAGGGLGLKNMADADILADIENIAAKAAGSMQITDLADIDVGSCGDVCQPGLGNALVCPEYSRKSELAWRVTSFSSLSYSGGRHGAAVGYRPSLRQVTGQRDIYSFPRGAKPGVFLHDILENVDFGMPNKAENMLLVADKLAEYGFDAFWQDVIHDMLINVLQAPLAVKQSPLCLTDLANDQRLAEMEFYFPLAHLKCTDLAAVFQRSDHPLALRFAAALQGLEFSDVTGFMKGFIDLTFEDNGRYYILDWKSNYLGGEQQDYALASLTEVMISELYFLQYHIYTLALHQHLKSRLPDYSYEENFGGIYYLFLRGINRQTGPDYGIFYDRPELSTVEELQRLFIGGL